MLLKKRDKRHVLPLVLAILFIAFTASVYAYPDSGKSTGSGHGGSHSNSNMHHSHQYQQNQYQHNYNHNYNQNETTGYPYYYSGYAVGGYIAPEEDATAANDYDNDDGDDVSPPPAQAETWVNASNGQVPYGAVVNLTDEGHPDGPAYYCQGVYNNEYESGILIPGEGCVLQDPANAATVVLSNYEVLVFDNNQ